MKTTKKWNKLFLLAMLGMVLGSGPLFAQANAVTIDVAPLFKGLIATDSDTDTGIFGIGASYERLLLPHFALGLRMDLYAGKVNDQSGVYFGLDAQGRVYPLSDTMEKLFIEAWLGFNTLSVENSDDEEFTSLTFQGKLGYLHFFNRAIFIEPGIGYVLAKSSSAVPVTPLGWQLACGVGFAF